MMQRSESTLSTTTRSSDLESQKRQRKGQESWRWVCRFNELDDASEGERAYVRFGVVRGKIKSTGEVVKIDLHDCKLQGDMTTNMIAIVSLRVLILFRNGLTGSIPENIGDLPNLEHFDCSQNALTGTIPDSIANLIKLRQLHVEHNQFTGTLPDVFANFPDLTHLTVNNNYLSGPIPDLSECRRLTQLHLHDNYFDGAISESLARCKHLNSLLLVQNCLQGDVPEAVTRECPFPTTPRSGVALRCQVMPQRSYEEIQQIYGSQPQQQDAGQGYYDEQGRYIQGYYDEWGAYVQGYYDENNQWISTGYFPV